MTTLEDELVPADVLDPALVNAAVEAVTASEPPEFIYPTDGPVDLPGGFRRFLSPGNFDEVRTAWVKELTGVDEERIAKAIARGNLNAIVSTILECGVEKLGDVSPREGELKNLVNGDRDFLILAISSATYGDEIEVEDYQCPFCQAMFTLSFSKINDVPTKRWGSVDEGEFEVTLRKGGTAHVRMSTGADLDATEKTTTTAEFNTVILQRCVSTIELPNGEKIDIGDNPGFVREKLGTADRTKIMSEMEKRACGPTMEIKIGKDAHPDCSSEKEGIIRVTWSELFRGL